MEQDGSVPVCTVTGGLHELITVCNLDMRVSIAVQVTCLENGKPGFDGEKKRPARGSFAAVVRGNQDV